MMPTNSTAEGRISIFSITKQKICSQHFCILKCIISFLLEKKTHKKKIQAKWIKQSSFAYLCGDGSFANHADYFLMKASEKYHNPGKLVSVDFYDWKKAIESFGNYRNKDYHKDYFVGATLFFQVLSGKHRDIS